MPRRSWRRGTASGPGFAEDCAFLVQAWLDLYEATFDVGWLDRALALQRTMDAHFWDADKGGYFSSDAGAPDVLVRLKEDYDGAEPAAGSIAALNLFRLSSLVSDEALRERGRRTIAALRGRWESAPYAMPQLLCAFEPALEPPRHVVLTGDPASTGVWPSSPTSSRSGWAPGAPSSPSTAYPGPGPGFPPGPPGWRPWATREPGPAAYVCEAFTCRSPARTPNELRKVLGQPQVAG